MKSFVWVISKGGWSSTGGFTRSCWTALNVCINSAWEKCEPSWPAAALRLCSHTMPSPRALSESLSSLSHTQQRDSESPCWPTPLPRHSDLSLCLPRTSQGSERRHKQKLSNNWLCWTRGTARWNPLLQKLPTTCFQHIWRKDRKNKWEKKDEKEQKAQRSLLIWTKCIDMWVSLLFKRRLARRKCWNVFTNPLCDSASDSSVQ